MIDRILHRPTGHLHLEVYLHDRLIEVFDAPNLVVNGYRLVQARLLGGDVTNRSVTQFGVGTNGDTPVPGNSALTGAYLNALTGVSYPASNQVQFAFELASGEANGTSIMEFGLLCADGTLFARRVRSAPLVKDAGISLTGTWTISY